MIKTTVIIPCYNAEKYLKETIDSILIQDTLVNIIAVDDGSTDKTFEILNSCKTKFLKIIKQEHGGLGKAMNTGVLNSNTPYYIHLSADDLLLAGFIKEAEFILDDNTNIDIVLPNYETFGKESWIWDLPGMSDELHHNNTVLFSSLTRKKLWSKIGGFEEHMPFSGIEDWEFWIRAYESGAKSFKTNKTGIKYRLHDNNITKITAAPHMDELVKWMKEHGRIK